MTEGRAVRVAIIDSGVEDAHPWLADARLSHLRVETLEGRHAVVPDPEGGDVSGHGTACAGIVHRMAPAAELVSVRALSATGRCSRNALITAIHHCVKQRYDVINLSLGIDLPRRAPLKVADHQPLLRLYELADAAYTLGLILVASGPNVEQMRTYPGRFKALIGVGRGSFDDWEGLHYERTQDYELVAPGNDILAPDVGGRERRWTGTSFATPFVSAHVARIRAARPEASVDEVRQALRRIARGESPSPSYRTSVEPR